MAVAVGEEVSPDVIRAYRRTSSERLSQIRAAGISDQRVALIDRLLAERMPGATPTPERELVKELAEPRTVAEIRFLKARETFREAGLEPIFRGGELVGVSDFRRKLDFPIENIGDIGKERLGILERGGLVRFEKEEIRFTPLPPPIKPKPDIFKAILPGLPAGIGLGLPGTPLFVGTKSDFIPFSDVTKAAFDEAAKVGFTKEVVAKGLSDSPIGTLDKKFDFLGSSEKEALKKLSSYQKEVILGGLKEIEERPEKIIVIGGISYLLPEILAGFEGMTFASNIINKIPAPIRKRGGQVLSLALGGLYLTSTGLEIAGEPTRELQLQKMGRILTSEIAPFAILTKLGVKGVLRKEINAELDAALAKLSPAKRAAFEDYIKQAELLGRFEPKAINIKLNNIESIKDIKAQNAIKKWLRLNKDEVVVGGSVAQTGQIDVKRALGDMDLYLEGKLTPTQAAKHLADILKKAGIERVSVIRGQITIAGKKAIEFHNIERLLTNIKQVIPSWQNPRRYIIRTPEGILIQRIGLQARRKAVAAFTDPRRIATGKYRKDLKDFKVIADKLFKKAEFSARKSFFFRETKIKRLERITRRRITREPIKIPSLLEKPKVKVKVKEPPRIKPPPPKKIIKPKFKKLSERGASQIEVRAKLIASQKPFSQIPIKKIIPPSQIPTILKKPRKIIPSQIPVKLKEAPRIVPPKIPKVEPPYKPIITPPRPPIIIPPKFPPVEVPRIELRRPPTKPPKHPFKTQTTKGKPLRKIPIPIKGEAYLAFVREVKRRFKTIEGKKVQQPRKFLLITKTPVSKQRAKDAMAYMVDHSLAAKGKIKRVPGKPRPLLLSIPRSYFLRTRPKFRDYKIVKGKKIPLKNIYIEKRGRPRLDTIEEKKKISAFRKLQQLRRQKKARFPKLKSTKLIRRKKK